MRSANLVITGGIAAFTTVLAIYTSPVGTRELHHWALSMGMFSSAACISWLFFVVLYSFKNNNLKGQVFILLGYALALVVCLISGGSFGPVNFVMHAEKVDFFTSFKNFAPIIIGGYAIATAILLGTVIYLKKQSPRLQGA
jgi:hypothetical protein